MGLAVRRTRLSPYRAARPNLNTHMPDPTPPASPTDKEILAAAKRATPGPWFLDDDGHVGEKLIPKIEPFRKVSAMGELYLSNISADDAAYLVLLPPAVVTRLVERAQAAERRVAELENDRHAAFENWQRQLPPRVSGGPEPEPFL